MLKSWKFWAVVTVPQVFCLLFDWQLMGKLEWFPHIIALLGSVSLWAPINWGPIRTNPVPAVQSGPDPLPVASYPPELTERLRRARQAVETCGFPPGTGAMISYWLCGFFDHSPARSDPISGSIVEVFKDLEKRLTEAKEANCRAFIAGAKWWEFTRPEGGTMWGSDQKLVYEEATRQWPYVESMRVRIAELEAESLRQKLAEITQKSSANRRESP